jgi:hypothetical protein
MVTITSTQGTHVMPLIDLIGRIGLSMLCTACRHTWQAPFGWCARPTEDCCDKCCQGTWLLMELDA